MKAKSLPSEHSSAARVLSTLVLFAIILNGLGLFLPVILFFLTNDFFGKLFFTSCFLLIGIERFWFSLFTSKEKNPVTVKQDWTFLVVGLTYSFMMYATIIEFYLRRYHGSFLITLAGFLLFTVSFLLRYWAVRTLGKQWAIHVEGHEKEGRHLVRTGPYRYVRHPIYLAAIFEVAGIPLFFNAFYSLIFALLVCIPLQIKRTYFEEKNSMALFGGEYQQYRKTTWAYWPMKKRSSK
jgi:protein-S-isoprenylcysteine O-methyltransferase Ste14